ncbi:MAG TPA: hypothetical protein VHD32_19385 [Candidatus Didemnitutus sp.]|nr:hypothetical protein [Candidatus Didemnitutus sp.]
MSSSKVAPFRYTLDTASSTACCTAHGVLTLADVEAHQSTLTAERDFNSIGAILWDFSEATGFDHSVARFVEKAEIGFAGKGKRRALVSPVKNDVRKLLDLWVLHCQAQGDSGVRCFDSVDKARVWLEGARVIS